MKIVTALTSCLFLLGSASSSSAFAEEVKMLQQKEEMKSFTIAANSGGGGVAAGRGLRDRARDRPRERQDRLDDNPSSGFGRSDEGLSSPDADEFRLDHPDPENTRRSLE